MKTSGPATNYSVTRGSLGWSHTRQLRADCDLLFTLELEDWPQAASSWATRERQWPAEQVLSSNVSSPASAYILALKGGECCGSHGLPGRTKGSNKFYRVNVFDR